MEITNTSAGNISLDVKFSEVPITNIHAVVRNLENLNQGTTVESDITKSINAVSIDWNKAKFDRSKGAKLPVVVNDPSSFLYDDAKIRDVVNNGLTETSQLIYMLEKFAESLGTYLLYIGRIQYTDSNNRTVNLEDIENVNDTIISEIFSKFKNEGKFENIRKEEDIYAPSTSEYIGGDGKSYHIRFVSAIPGGHYCYMICPKFMFLNMMDNYHNVGNQYSFLLDRNNIGGKIVANISNAYTYTDTSDNIEYIIVYIGAPNKELVFIDYHITNYPTIFGNSNVQAL